MTIEVKDIESEARAELAKERMDKAKTAIKAQLRNVEAARQVLQNEERKLEDIKAQIKDGEL